MPVRFAGRRHTARRRHNSEKQKSAKKETEKDQSKQSESRRRPKSAPSLSASQRAKLPDVDYDQALRKLVRASEILERSTKIEKDVDKNLEEIHKKLEPTQKDY